MDPRLLHDIKTAEGCRLVAYKDTLGNWTIGYGHLLQAGIDWEGHEISQSVADELLEQDVATALLQAGGLPEFSTLNRCRKNAVVELVFNMGLRRWEGFARTRSALQASNWTGAAHELNLSHWAVQVGTFRSTRLSGYFLHGTYPEDPNG